MPESARRPRMIRVRAEIPAFLRSEFEELLSELLAGERPRMDALAQDVAGIERRASGALATIVNAIEAHPTTGQARRLVRFLAGLYNGPDYPFDLTELRGLDIALANACLDYLNYDRLGITEVHRHLPGGDTQLHGWMRRCGLLGDEDA